MISNIKHFFEHFTNKKFRLLSTFHFETSFQTSQRSGQRRERDQLQLQRDQLEQVKFLFIFITSVSGKKNCSIYLIIQFYFKLFFWFYNFCFREKERFYFFKSHFFLFYNFNCFKVILFFDSRDLLFLGKRTARKLFIILFSILKFYLRRNWSCVTLLLLFSILDIIFLWK